MNWSRKAPTKPGWYQYRPPDAGLIVSYRIVQAQADRFCSTVQGPVVLPALADRTEEGAQYGAAHVG
jgi:hypothetical protein